MNIDKIYGFDLRRQKFVLPLNTKINSSINTFIGNNTRDNILVIYGPYQSGKTYVANQIKRELINDSYTSYSLNVNCANDSVANNSIEIFFNINQTSQNKTLNQQIDKVFTAFGECNSQNITNLLANLSSANKIFVTLPEFQKNGSNYLNLTTEKLNELENVSFIIESSDYNFIMDNNSNISVIETEPIYNSSLMLSQKNSFLSVKEVKVVEELFGGNIGPIIRTVNDVKKGGKFKNVISSIEKEIQDNLTTLTNDFNFSNDFSNLCNSSILISNVNLSQLSSLNYLFKKGLLYVNESYFINFANPIVKKFLCQKIVQKENELNSTEIPLNDTSINATEINGMENLSNITSQSFDKEINLTVNETNLTSNSFNETDNLNNITSNSINETENISNLTSNTFNETENLSNLTSNSNNETDNLNNITSDSINETDNVSNITSDSINETENLNNITSDSINETENLNNITANSTNESEILKSNEPEKTNKINDTENVPSKAQETTSETNSAKSEKEAVNNDEKETSAEESSNTANNDSN